MKRAIKNTVYILLLLSFVVGQAQQKYVTRAGTIDFFSHAPMEDIKAVNSQVAAIINAQDGSLTFALLIKSFEFEKALMQEHFNENYMESDDYPKATFKGEIMDFTKSLLMEEGIKEVSVAGQLTIHGVTKEVEASAKLDVKKDGIKAQSSFIVKPDDYQINIPKLVRNNIAKEIEVNVDLYLKPR